MVRRKLAVEEREIAALRRLGLTEYESRIYLALVRMGPKKASEVSFFGQVPRTKAYGAIRELEHKGLLRIIPGNPELYAPSSPSEVLMPLMSKLNRDVKHSEDVVQTLALTYESSKFLKRESPKEVTEFWQMEGRQNVFNKITQVFNDAKKSVKYSTSASGLIRAYKAHSDVLEKARKQGATVRVISPISPENASVAEEFSEIVDLRQIESPLTASFISVDTHELVVIESKPDDLRTDRGSDTAIWTSNRLLVELHEQLFDMVWGGLQSPKFPRQRGQ
jgi:sugar-specific transcriptional regulator TrmB